MLFFFKWPCRPDARLCWAEHAARTERHVANTELNLGNAKTLPMFEHWDLNRYGECTLNYRHSPSRHEMKGTTSLTGSLYHREKSTVSTTQVAGWV